MRVLALDSEMTPNLAHVWALWNVGNVSLSQLMESQEMMCWGAKWVGDKKFHFASTYHDGKQAMLENIWTLVDEADVILGWNSKAYDMKHLRREWLEAGMEPPSEVQHLDLMLTARSQFKFPSNKLQYVAELLLGEGKVQHSGHDLWVKCMAGDPKAWATMKRYQKQDVDLLEPLYKKLRPWVKNHPNMAVIDGLGHACPRCGSGDVQRRGLKATGVGVYQQYQCNACKGWSRGAQSVRRTELRPL